MKSMKVLWQCCKPLLVFLLVVCLLVGGGAAIRWLGSDGVEVIHPHRALANDPLLILADEPTGNLDSASSENVENILKQLAHQYHRAVAVVTHETRFAATADSVITIVDGRVQG